MAGELELGGIVMRIRADMSGVQKGVDQLEREMGRMTQSTQKAGGQVEGASQKMAAAVNANSMSQVASYAAIAMAATKAMSAVIGAIETGIAAINKYRAALIGLESVASGKGISSEKMTEALNKVTDAFFDVGDASTSFKNLLARGYDIDQATQVILRLKDAAAFGRQSALGFAEAVRSATEGLKNENSMLVDNAGVTKNVAKMWLDYAKSIGVAVTSLTLAQKIEAEVNGVLHETRFQVGDLAKLQLTLAGTQAATALAGEQLARAYGESMSPAVGTVTELFGIFLGALTEVVKAFPGLIAGVTAAGLAVGGFIVVQKAAIAFQALTLAMQAAAGGAALFGAAINTAFPIVLAIGAVIGIGTAIYTNHALAQEKAAKAAEEAAKQEKAHRDSLEKSVTELSNLSGRYEELVGKTALTYAESNELLEIERTLMEQYGITGAALSTLSGQYGTVTAAIREKRIEMLKELQIGKEQMAQESKANFEDAQGKALAGRQYQAYNREIARLNAERDELYQESSARNWNDFIGNDGSAITQAIYDLQDARDRLRQAAAIDPAEFSSYDGARAAAAADFVRAQIDAIAGAYEIGGGQINAIQKTILDRLFLNIAAAPTNAIQVDPQKIVDAYTQALNGADIGPAIQAMEDVQRKILTGVEPTEADTAIIQSSWEQILSYAKSVGKSLGFTDAEVLNFATMLAPVMSAAANSVTDVSKATTDLENQWKTQNMSGFIGASADEMKAAFETMRTSMETETANMTAIGAKLRGQTGIIAALETLKTALDTGDTKMIKAASDALESLGQQAPKSIEEVNKALVRQNAYRASTMDELQSQMDTMVAMEKSFANKQKALADEGKQDTPEYRALEAFIQRINEVKAAAGFDLRYKGMTIVADGQPKIIDAATASTSDLVDAQTQLNAQLLEAAAKQQEYTKALQAFQTLQAGLASGDTTSQAFKDAEAYLKSLPEFAYAALDSMDFINQQIAWQGVLMTGNKEKIDEMVASSKAYVEGMKTQLASMDPGSQAAATLQSMIEAFEQLIALGDQIGSGQLGIPGVVNGFDMAKASSEEFQAELDKAVDTAGALAKKLKEKANMRVNIAEIKKVADAQIQGKASAESWAKAQNDFAKTMGYSAQTAEQMAGVTGLALTQIDADLETLKGESQGAVGWVQQLLSYINSNSASLDVDTSAAISALSAFISIYNAVAGLFGWAQIGGGVARRGGGGGGGKKSGFAAALATLEHQVSMGRKSLEGELKALIALQKKYKKVLTLDERRDLEQRIADVKEEIRQRDIQKDLNAIEHKKAMGKLTIAAEIAALKHILKAHKLNAEERREIEEQLYAAQEALRQEALNNELRRISHRVTMGEMSTAQELAALQKLLKQTNLTAEERMSIEEQVFDAQERLRQEKLQWELDLLDHQVAMGNMSLQQELAYLQSIRAAHELNAKEVMDIDEQIYDLQQKIIDEQERKTKTAYDHIIQALRNRLAEQRKLETEAIDDRIEELNALTKAENEAVRKEDYARSLADKQYELSVEKSARRRRELQEEIAKMEADEALRLAQEARQAEIDALNEQKDVIGEKYDKLMEEEALRQEALRLVMSNNLQEMTDLIASYGEEWKDAGGSLAEALTNGLLLNSGSILSTIDQLTTAIQDSINDQLISIGASIPNALTPVSGVTININGGLTVREEADVGLIADELYGMVQAAGR